MQSQLSKRVQFVVLQKLGLQTSMRNGQAAFRN
jgi:hypothetical protein